MEESNKEEIKGGGPFKFTHSDDFKLAVNAYFDSCDPHVVDKFVDGGINQQGETIWLKRAVMTPQRPYTLSGLARALGVDRSTLLNYQDPEHYSEEISEDVRQSIISTLKLARARCEEYAESQLFEGNANGAKFNLTNNYDRWTDKTVQEHEGGFFGTGGRLEVEIVNPEPLPDEPVQAEAQPDPEPGPTPSS
jgi:hypothetical protein